MSTTTLEPVGVEITDLALRDVDAAAVIRLRDLLADHGVAVIRDQDLDDAAFVEFLASFGELMFTEGETPVPGFPDLNEVSNVGRTTPPRSVFHVDTSYVRRPPAYTALRAVEIPSGRADAVHQPVPRLRHAVGRGPRNARRANDHPPGERGGPRR